MKKIFLLLFAGFIVLPWPIFGLSQAMLVSGHWESQKDIDWIELI